ncbi:hypothetical protein E2C01_052796 [Portunus trituberculatus]|uniref:Uncharacterized protein n=1 Tax=Portunus trituberculatus TaxID=210409 RepID=A0A5B7GNF9_PORTR|nr:hypothetical protein [Portunus trituberculatus]
MTTEDARPADYRGRSRSGRSEGGVVQGQLVIIGSRSPTQQGRCADVMFQQILQAVQSNTGSSAISYLSLSELQVCGGGLSMLSVVRLVLGALQYDCITVFVGSVGESCFKFSIHSSHSDAV